jgi:hypothetical protein
MDKQQIALHNEQLAKLKIQSTYADGDLHGAMKLCQDFMGMNARAAYDEVLRICGEKGDTE